MKIAYLILAHTAPAQLGRLVTALSTETSRCFVHLDAKSDLSDFAHLEHPHVRFTTTRVPVFWGDYSQVEAILSLLETALDDPDRFERFVLISGVDHPVKSASSIERFFEARPQREFLNIVPLPDDELGKPISRLTTYQPRPRPSVIGSAMWKLAMAIGPRVHRRDYERHLNGLTPYGGSTWWALTRDASEYVLNFTHRETRVVSFFRHVVSPDESYIHTVLGNSCFRPQIDRNVTYTDWSDGGANPAVLTEVHLERLTRPDGSENYLFARKFSDDDRGIVASLDQHIAENERAAQSQAVSDR